MIKLKGLINEANDNVNDFDFSKDELDFIAALINNEGSGDHPWADSRTVGGFRIKYVKDLLKKAKTKIPSKYNSIVKSVNSKLQ